MIQVSACFTRQRCVETVAAISSTYVAQSEHLVTMLRAAGLAPFANRSQTVRSVRLRTALRPTIDTIIYVLRSWGTVQNRDSAWVHAYTLSNHPYTTLILRAASGRLYSLCGHLNGAFSNGS